PAPQAYVDLIALPDSDARDRAEALWATMSPTATHHAGGPAHVEPVLSNLAGWLSGTQGQCPPKPLEHIRLVAFAADHGVADDVSISRDSATQVQRLAEGSTPAAILAAHEHAGVRIVDIGMRVPAVAEGALARAALADGEKYKVRAGSGAINIEAALRPEE